MEQKDQEEPVAPEETEQPEATEDQPAEPVEPEATEDQPAEPEVIEDQPAVAEEPEALEEQTDEPKDPEAKEEVTDLDEKDKEEPETEASDQEVTYPSFEESKAIDDVKITVTADEGAFPEGAALYAQKVTKAQKKEVEEAVGEERPDGENVAISYTYDIKVLDKDGEEIQPANGQEVKVSFELPHAADKNLNANVYHIKENEEEDAEDLSADAISDAETETSEGEYTVEKLDTDTDTDEETVTVETDGFSFYTVEFTYGDLQYVMEGGDKVRLTRILSTIGLEGEVENVSVSNAELFSASRENGEWIITSHMPFTSEEWMKITINGVEYQVTVTDDSDVVLINSWSELQNAVGNNNGKKLTLINDIYADGKDRIKIKNKTLTIDLNGHIMDRQRTKSDDNGHVIELQDGANVTIKDGSPSKSGVITGGYAEHGGGIHVGKGTVCTIESGNIKNNRSSIDGGGIYIRGTLIMKGGSVTDNYAEDTAGGIYCVDTGTFDIANARIANNTAKNDGGGFVVHLKSDATIRDSVISGNKTEKDDGGAIRMDAGKKLNIINTEISGNTAADTGGGIRVEDGTVNMTGGSIKNNTAKDGGGVYNDDGMLAFDGVEISGNTSTESGGAGVNNKNDANLKNCTIRNNTGNARGGGIYADDDITLEGCTIDGNNSTDDGGGIYFNNVTATVKSCTLTGNHTNKSGGGIRIEDGKVYVIDSIIKDGNSANEYGGGIYVNNDAELYFTGTNTITGNSCNNGGGGLLVGYDNDTAGIQDTLVIKDNTSSRIGSDVLLRFIDEERIFESITIYEHELKWTELKVTGKLNEDSYVGVATEEPFKTTSRAITKDYGKYHNGDDPGRYLIAGAGFNVVEEDGEAYISTSLWTGLQRQIDDAAKNADPTKRIVVLDQNWKAHSKDKSLFIGADQDVTIDLNGHTIDRDRLSEKVKDAGEVFTVHGKLTVIDSSKGQKGKITGGHGKRGGGVYVHKGGSFTLNGGNISGNKAENGGGIYNYLGTVTITGGTISGNSADTHGGGVYNEPGDAGTATLTLSGGKITGNDAGYRAGGVYVGDGSVLNVSGTPVVNDNNSALGRNILLFDNSYITFGDNLDNDALLDFSVKRDNNTEKRITNDFSKVTAEHYGELTYNGKSYAYSAATSPVYINNGELYLKESTPTSGTAISSWDQLRNFVKDNSDGAECYLVEDLKSDDNDGIVVKRTVTIDLNGHFIDRNRDNGSVLRIEKNEDEIRTLTIKDSGGTGTICGGDARDGGGIYVEDNTKLVMTGGTIANNKASETGGGIYCSDGGTLNLNGVTITHNTAGNKGGGLRIHLNTYDSSMTDCTISNNTAEDDDNEDGGGGISLSASTKTLTISGGEISDNTAKNGGGIFVYEGSNLVLNNATISGNSATSAGGAGINNTESTVTLNGCTISDNTAETTGAGIWTSGGSSTTITGSNISSNYAKESGGGIHTYGNTVIDGGTKITGNMADVSAAGVLVETNNLHINGKVMILDNMNGQNLCLGDNKLIVDNALDDATSISVSVNGGVGVFTSGYSDKCGAVDPAKYFLSDDGYNVYKTADETEAEIRQPDLNDGSSFIPWTSQITDESRLTPKNWMSGISGDRYLNEINLPCSHDSSMNIVAAHDFSSVGSYLGYSGYARTQRRFINQQMNEGVRRFDIRLTTVYEVSSKFGLDIDAKDDEVNLYNNHGKDKVGGSYWAKDDEGNLQTLTKVLSWVKEFLKEHPTEVIILDLSPEVPQLYFSKSKIPEVERKTYERAQKIIKEQINGNNPSTNKPYVYWQNGEFKPFTSYPQLKDCRGQVIFKCSDREFVGGLVDTAIYPVTSTDGPIGGSTGCSVKEKIKVVREFLGRTTAEIPSDVTGHLPYFYSASVLAAPSGIESIPTVKPLDAAAEIQDDLFYNDGPFDQRGKYVGWIRQDDVNTQVNRFIWVSNFPQNDTGETALDYVTVTAQADSSGTSKQTYKLLKGTQITIPGNIYGGDRKLYHWDATVPSGSEANVDVECYPDEIYTVMKDVTFTADWIGIHNTISAVWVDGGYNERPSELTVVYKPGDNENSESISISDGDDWKIDVNNPVAQIESVSAGYGDENISIPYMTGSQTTASGYYYKVRESGEGSWVIMLFRMPATPQVPEYLNGTIIWEDYDNADHMRPSGVELILKNSSDSEVGRKFIGEDDDWNWYFNLGINAGSQPESYKPEQKDIGIIAGLDHKTLDHYDIKREYNTDFGKWIITNTLKNEFHTHVLQYVDRRDSTCISLGNKEFWYCEVCGRLFWDEAGTDEITDPGTIISLLSGHDLKKIDGIDATCTNAGRIEYWICDRCGACFKDQLGKDKVNPLKSVSKGGVIIPAKKHSWGEPVYTWADDNSTATAKRICKNDASHVQSETVKAETEVTKEAACETAGEMICTATFKNGAFDEQKKTASIPALGHSFGEWKLVDATKGVMQRTCTRCGKVETKSDGLFGIKVTTGGHGSATASRVRAKAGKKITIKATPKAGYKFKKWTVTKGVKLKNAKSSSTSFTMPAKNVTVKAIFEKIYARPWVELESAGKDAITIKWSKVSEAQGYGIFMSRCNHDGKEVMTKLVKTVKGNKTFKWKATGLKPYKSYKVYVRAYIKKDGKKKYISHSSCMHVYTAGGTTRSYTNAKSVKLDTSDGKIKKKKLTLKAKDTYKIKASVKKSKSSRKLMPDSHVKTLRYDSSDPGIAKVSSSGKITGVRKGSCKIYVYAHNGVKQVIKITVK